MTASSMTLNATLLVELVVFVVVLGVLARFVIRPLQAAMDRRQAEIDQALAKAQHIEELPPRPRPSTTPPSRGAARSRTSSSKPAVASVAIWSKKGQMAPLDGVRAAPG